MFFLDYHGISTGLDYWVQLAEELREDELWRRTERGNVFTLPSLSPKHAHQGEVMIAITAGIIRMLYFLIAMEYTSVDDSLPAA